MKNKERVLMMVESAMLLALGVILELVSKLIPGLPFGGQVTLLSMLPVVLISYRHGVKWGVLSASVYSILQMALGWGTVSAAFQPGTFGEERMVFNAILMLLLDYFLAYTALGLGGIFRNKIKSPAWALVSGSVVALSVRYLMHILSGYILYSAWAEWFFTQEGFPAWGKVLVESLSADWLGFIYSVVYNGMYMIPEIILTSIGALLIAKVPKIVAKK